MRIENEIKLDFKDVLIRPKRSTLKSRNEVDLEREFEFRHSKIAWNGVPIIAANMDTVATFEMARALAKHKMMTAIHKHYTVDEWIEFSKTSPELFPYIAASSGTSDADFTKLKQIMDKTNVQTICLDVANGYSEHFVNFLRKVREACSDATIIAGNVVTGEMVEELVLSGADIVKVGIGPGSVCTTRKKTGVGYPQLSAVIECADAAHGLHAHIISDGGCTVPGDIAKAFGAGADYVMIGGMLAGHEECGGKTIVEPSGKKYKEFYGMSSATAMQKHVGKLADYRASEGKHVLIPYRGPVDTTIMDILGGLRSACTYVGAEKLKHLSKRTTFVRVNQQTNEFFGAYETSQDSLKDSKNK
jgi:GMP reductase